MQSNFQQPDLINMSDEELQQHIVTITQLCRQGVYQGNPIMYRVSGRGAAATAYQELDRMIRSPLGSRWHNIFDYYRRQLEQGPLVVPTYPSTTSTSSAAPAYPTASSTALSAREQSEYMRRITRKVLNGTYDGKPQMFVPTTQDAKSMFEALKNVIRHHADQTKRREYQGYLNAALGSTPTVIQKPQTPPLGSSMLTKGGPAPTARELPGNQR